MNHAWGSAMEHPDMERCSFEALSSGDLFTIPSSGILWLRVYPGLRREDGRTMSYVVQVGGRHGSPGTLEAWTLPGDVIPLGDVSTYLGAVLDDDAG